MLTEWHASAQRVAAASPECLARGVRPGMDLAQARVLCPGAALAPHDPAGDATALARLARWAVAFSPRVGLDAPDGLLLDITGCAHLFGGERAMLDRLCDTLAADGVTACAAVADTVGAAWAVARAGPAPREAVPPGQVYAALAALPPWSLRLSPETAGRLAALGIDRAEALFMLPRATLPARFGDEALLRVDQALGRQPENFESIDPPADLALRLRFEWPLQRPEALELACRQLLERLAAGLQRRACGTRRLALVLHREGGRAERIDLPLCEPSCSLPHLWRLLQAQLERVDLARHAEGRMQNAESADHRLVAGAMDHRLKTGATDPRRCGAGLQPVAGFEPVPGLQPVTDFELDATGMTCGIVAITLAAFAPAPLDAEQGDFFDAVAPQRRAARRETAELFDRLSQRLGPDRVVRPVLSASHRPERAWRAEKVSAADNPFTRLLRRPSRPESRPIRSVPATGAADPPALFAGGAVAGGAVNGGAVETGAADGGSLVPSTPAADWGGAYDGAAPAGRPLRLLPRPQPIEVIAMAPDRPPGWFRYRGREFRTRDGAGPERLCAEWWTGENGTRDYYRVEAESGARFWIYCEVESRKWYMHGVFE